MNSTSSLLAGGIILFGAVALANLYLPAHYGVKDTSKSSAIDTQVVPQRSALPPKVLIATPGPFVQKPSASTVAPSADSPTGLSGQPTSVANNSASPSDASSAPDPVVNQKTPAIVIPKSSGTTTPNIFSRDQTSKPKTTPARHVKARKAIALRERHDRVKFHREDRHRRLAYHRESSGPILNSPRNSRTPVPIFDRHTRESGFTLSATLNNRAWIREGNRKTLMVTVGSVIPGLGKITAISASSVRFNSGKVLREHR